MKKILSIYCGESGNIFSAGFDASEKGLVILDLGNELVKSAGEAEIFLTVASPDIFTTKIPGTAESIGAKGLARLADEQIKAAFPGKSISDFLCRASDADDGKMSLIEFIPFDAIEKAKSSFPDLNIRNENIFSSTNGTISALMYNYPIETKHVTAVLDFYGKNFVLLTMIKNGKQISESLLNYSDIDELTRKIAAESDLVLSIPGMYIDSAYLSGEALTNEAFAAAEKAFGKLLVSAKFLNPFRLVSGAELSDDKKEFCVEYSSALAPVCGAAISAFSNSILL